VPRLLLLLTLVLFLVILIFPPALPLQQLGLGLACISRSFRS
jgi:hypothetical protein